MVTRGRPDGPGHTAGLIGRDGTPTKIPQISFAMVFIPGTLTPPPLQPPTVGDPAGVNLQADVSEVCSRLS